MERNINVWLPLTWPPLGTWPATQACAMIGNRTATLWFTAHAQSTELHCPGLDSLFKKKKNLIYFYTEGKGRRNRGRETSICSCLSHTPYWRPGPQPRHVPWLELNWRAFGLQACTQSTDPHQPGPNIYFSQFWKLEFWDQGSIMVGFFIRTLFLV